MNGRERQINTSHVFVPEEIPRLLRCALCTDIVFDPKCLGEEAFCGPCMQKYLQDKRDGKTPTPIQIDGHNPIHTTSSAARAAAAAAAAAGPPVLMSSEAADAMAASVLPLSTANPDLAHQLVELEVHCPAPACRKLVTYGGLDAHMKSCTSIPRLHKAWRSYLDEVKDFPLPSPKSAAGLLSVLRVEKYAEEEKMVSAQLLRILRQQFQLWRKQDEGARGQATATAAAAACAARTDSSGAGDAVGAADDVDGSTPEPAPAPAPPAVTASSHSDAPSAFVWFLDRAVEPKMELAGDICVQAVSLELGGDLAMLDWLTWLIKTGPPDREGSGGSDIETAAAGVSALVGALFGTATAKAPMPISYKGPGSTYMALAMNLSLMIPKKLHLTPVESEDGRTLLMEAALSNKAHLVDVMCCRGAASSRTVREFKCSIGWTALMYACQCGHSKVVKALLKQECDVALKEEGTGTTALMCAARMGHVDVVKTLLLTNQSEPDARNKQGWTALFFAAAGKHRACVSALLAFGARASTKDSCGNNILFYLDKWEGEYMLKQVKKHCG